MPVTQQQEGTLEDMNSRPAAATNRSGGLPSGEPLLEDELDFSRYARVLARHWPTLLVCAALGAAVGVAQTLIRPTLYESVATLLATSQSGSQVGLATSRALLQNNALMAETLRDTGLDKPPFNLTPQSFVGGALQIEDVPGTNLLRLRVRLQDPRKAAEAATILARRAVDLNRGIASAESSSIRAQLAEHLQAAADRLQKAEQELLAYRKTAQLELLQTDTDAILERRAGLVKLLLDIEAEKSRLAAAEQEILKHEPLLAGRRSADSEQALRRAARPLATPQDVMPETEAADPESLDLSNPFVNPVYQTLALQIATGRARLAGLERQRREMVVGLGLGDDHLPKLSELYKRELELSRLQADYDLAKRMHGELALRFEQSRSEPLNRMVYLQVVDEAIPADRPLSKRGRASVGLGLAGGLGAGLLLVLLLGSRPRRAGAIP